MDLVSEIENQLGRLGLGLFPLPPRPSTLDGFTPDLSLIPRDAEGIINQEQGDGSLDGGDSAHKTGVAAFCNSKPDQSLLTVFEADGIMVRHPTQHPWNNWRNCSRDQLLAYCAGCWRAGRSDICQRLFIAHATRIPPFTCQNTERDEPGTTKDPAIGDPMGPHDIMSLKICAGDPAAFLSLVDQFALQVIIELSDPDVEVEKNQILLQSIICGRLNLYVQVHPNYRENIRHYWSGWRKEPQIAEALVWVVEKELERYKGIPVIPLLPQNLIRFLRETDWQEEFRTIDPGRIPALATKFAEATLKDAAAHFLLTLNLAINEVARQLSLIAATAEQIAHSLAALNQTPNLIRGALENLGLSGAVVSKAMSLAFPGIPHVDGPVAPHVDVAAKAHVDVAPIHTDIAAAHGDTAGVHGDVTILGAHADSILTPHADGILTPHMDAIATPHVDEAPSAHVDTPAQGHVDTP